ncbi:MAG: protein kinase [Phycisphaerae bacterium]|nr:protein kinase [Phycisphaerae bacterium]
MPGKLTLEIAQGKMAGKRFEFEEHDTFIFGRMPDCHMCLPDDNRVSRHHFILEANPPDARIRDLGSLNGTHVNGTRHGGREKGETPEEGAKRTYPEVDLKDGDRIKVGQTEILVGVYVPAECCECGKAIADGDRKACAWIGDTFICPGCRSAVLSAPEPPKKPEPVRCLECGKDVSDEIGKARRGKYVCEACRAKAEEDPIALLKRMMAEIGGGAGSVPNIAGVEIIRELGRGGMGAVYLARRKGDDGPTALKVMLSRVAVDERSRTSFLREMETTRDLKHPNIVEFIDHGAAGSAFYFVMEFCEGGSVDGLMEKCGGTLPLDVAGPIMLDALEGLAYAHDQDFVHRDLKPANILLTGPPETGTAKVTDFGLSKNFEKAGFSGMTVTGAVAGTPVFMPREQVTNFKYVKPATDVWSMGATLYNMLTGRFPRDMRRGQDPMEVILNGKIVPVRKRESSIPKKVAEVIDRSLENDLKARYQDAGEMRQALVKAL